jgi:hypothetical protein
VSQVYHLYLQLINGKPLLGPEATSGYFVYGTTVALVMADKSKLYLNVDMTPSTSYKVCHSHAVPLAFSDNVNSHSPSVLLPQQPIGTCQETPSASATPKTLWSAPSQEVPTTSCSCRRAATCQAGGAAPTMLPSTCLVFAKRNVCFIFPKRIFGQVTLC